MPRSVVALALVATLALQPSVALAYIGPGLGVGAITAIFGVLAAIIMAFVALLWYPIKRLLRRKRPAGVDRAQ